MKDIVNPPSAVREQRVGSFEGIHALYKLVHGRRRMGWYYAWQILSIAELSIPF